jgi:hypothetical protein
MRIISRPQLLGWMVWASIRGPIGGLREDYYTAFLARYGGNQYPAEVSVEDFRMPWFRPEPEDED